MKKQSVKKSFQNYLKSTSGLRKAGSYLLPVAAATALLSTSASAVTLEDAVRASLLTNPEVGIVAENRRAVEYELEQSHAGYLPTLDLSLAGGFGTLSDPASRAADTAGNQDNGWVSMPRYESGLTLRQMIFDGFAT